MGRLRVVVGGQLGSEGKGAIAAWLSRPQPGHPLLAVRVGGPNAGHTVIGRCPPLCSAVHRIGTSPLEAHPWRLRHVPVAAVTNPDAVLLLAQGSEVDTDLLHDELAQLDSAGYNATARMSVDRSATVIEPRHVSEEHHRLLPERIGSTGKGIGAARSSRLMRTALEFGEFESGPPVRTRFSADGASMIRTFLAGQDSQVLIEGTQGYGLGLHAGFYPYCTSGDCTALDMLAQAGVPPWLASSLEIWVTLRTFVIRVAGNSGPLAGETTWDDLGLPQEHTTVTGNVRRVGRWDPELARRALIANGGYRFGPDPGSVRVALTMADYIVPGLAGQESFDKLSEDTQAATRHWLSRYEADLMVPVSLLGTGPATVIDLRDGDEL